MRPNWEYDNLTNLCVPKQWPTIQASSMTDHGYPVYGANGVIGYFTAYNHTDPIITIGCRGTCGAVHIATPMSYVTGNAMSLDDLDNKRVYIKYLYYYLSNRGFKDVVSGSSQPQITQTGLQRVIVPLPPLDEQQRIAAILDKADAIRQKRQESIRLTEEFLRSTFLEMFGDPVTNPKNFERESLGELIKLSSGEFLPASKMDQMGQYPVYGGNGINGYHSEYLFDKPIIIIGRVGVYCGAVHMSQGKCWVTDNAMVVSPMSDQLDIIYLYEALVMANLNQYSSQAAQPLISGSRVYPVNILVPPISLQLRFADIKKRLNNISNRQNILSHETAKLFDALTQRAFRGELS